MSTSNSGVEFIKGFRDFVVFLQSLWGILAGISIFFPLSNAFTKSIPLEMWDEGGFAVLHPDFITTITTLITIFIIFWIYGQRHEFKAHMESRLIRRQAGLSFIFGVLALIVYYVVYNLMKSNFHYSVMGWYSEDPRRVFFDLVLLLAYTAFFGLITRAFVLLGMIEYFRKS
jgi:hypothetical protein